ncbi:ATP-dependent endonuclease [Streptococcus danieliae]|uniref:ATP-dependent nuclease n=1 Tax=Streptococcus danieliae TaxID=747656 RepID=UPI0026E9689A|nr:AAA family ATPase [Streptococcus danieliae]
MFDSQFVWSDLNSDEYNNFGKTTTIVSKLINNITENFRKSDTWIDFEKAHEETFGDEGLVSILNGLQSKIEEVMKAQYGETKVNFSFGIPTIDNFFKTGQILLEDNGIQTNISEKGTGMQRALALTLIQVYSQIGDESGEITKPILFFIDEPETFLHPSAQDKLLQSLNDLSTNHQIFITTHSPYLLKNFDSEKNKLSIFSRDGHTINIEDDIQLNLFPYSPSWGEINYKAFGVVSEEFHNELFGLLHNKTKENNKTYNGGNRTVSKRIASFDDWLIEQDPSHFVDNDHQNKNRDRVDRSMSTYIRNYIDHPGDDETLSEGYNRNKPTIVEIRRSIESMLKIYTDNYL